MRQNGEHTVKPPTPLGVWMQRAGLSDAALGAALGYDRTLIFRIRKGKRLPSGEFKLRLLRSYGLAAAQELFPDDFAEAVAA